MKDRIFKNGTFKTLSHLTGNISYMFLEHMFLFWSIIIVVVVWTSHRSSSSYRSHLWCDRVLTRE